MPDCESGSGGGESRIGEAGPGNRFGLSRLGEYVVCIALRVGALINGLQDLEEESHEGAESW